MKKKSIDSLFADKLQQAEITPREEAWAKLQNKMAKKEKKIVWLPFARWSAAASLVLLVGAGVWFINSPKKQVGVELAQTKPQPKPVADSKPKPLPESIALVKTREIQTAGDRLLNVTIGSKTITQNSKLKIQNYPAPQPEIIIVKNEKTNIESIEKKTEIVAPEPKLETIAAIQPVSKPEKIVRLELTEPVEQLPEVADISSEISLLSNIAKEKRINKIFRQLKNLKNGDDIDWKEVGVKSPKLLARLNRNQD